MGVIPQIAQKIHACTKTVNGTNNRVHDLYDITLLEPLIAQDIPKLKQACQHVFKKRDTHPWPPKLNEWEHWPKLWENLEIPEDHKIEYATARQTVTNLIEQLT